MKNPIKTVTEVNERRSTSVRNKLTAKKLVRKIVISMTVVKNSTSVLVIVMSVATV